jgi:hypothetical protein
MQPSIFTLAALHTFNGIDTMKHNHNNEKLDRSKRASSREKARKGILHVEKHNKNCISLGAFRAH